MKKINRFLFSRKNSMYIAVAVITGAVSQPLITICFTKLADILFVSGFLISSIVQIIFLLLFAIILSGIADGCRVKVTNDAALSLRNSVFKKILGKSLEDFEKVDSGSYYATVWQNVEIIQRRLYDQYINLIRAILTIAIISMLLLYVHWTSFFAIAFFMVPLTLNNLLFPDRIGRVYEKYKSKDINLITALKDTLNGFSAIKFQCAEKNFEEKMNAHFIQANRLGKKLDLLNSISGLIANGGVTLSQFSGLFVGLFLYVNGKIDMPSFLLIFQLGSIINLPVVDAINSMISLRSIEPYKAEFSSLLSDMPHLGNEKLTERIKTISFENVSFSYLDNSRKILNGFNYTFECGKTYLIVGESGSGKTTLAKLMLKLLSPRSGKIYINGVDISTICDDEIYRRSFWVSQKNVIFDDTIRNNIDLANAVSDNIVTEAISKSNLNNFMNANCYTFESKINDEVFQVSGGEKARISFARSWVANRELVIYDEVLSSLDKENAYDLEELILMKENIIKIHISHRSAQDLQEKYDGIIQL